MDIESRRNYEVHLLGGFVNLNTLSPDAKHFYRITEPKEIRMSVFGSRLAFFDVKDQKLLYCTPSKTFAFWLPPFDKFQNVYWSGQGKYAAFNHFDGIKTSNVTYDLDSGIMWERLHQPDCDLLQLNEVLNNESEVERYLIEQNYEARNLESNHSSEYSSGFIRRKWHP